MPVVKPTVAIAEALSKRVSITGRFSIAEMIRVEVRSKKT